MNVKLNDFISNIDTPCLFKNILVESEQANSACGWTPRKLSELLADEKLTFRIGNKRTGHQTKVQFENECEYVESTLSEFVQWLDSSNESDTNCKRLKLEDDKEEANTFENYSIDEHWAYADYKYMIELIKSDQNFIRDCCIDWSEFGFDERNAKQSTLWVGSQGAYTPCHFDTYGYNLVFQIYGKKRWTLMSKEDTPFMYPVRIPFEESTVYSEVCIKSPDLHKYPLFSNVKPYVVDLEPGDVLYVPKNWWHFVENLTTSISVNSWIELEVEDNYSRLKEILSRTVIQGLMESNFVDFDKWANSSENYSSQSENMQLVAQCVQSIDESQKKPKNNLHTGTHTNWNDLIQLHKCFSRFIQPISFNDFLANYTIIRNEESNFNQNTEDQADDHDKAIDILTHLSNAISSPDTMNLIVEKFLKNLNIKNK